MLKCPEKIQAISYAEVITLIKRPPGKKGGDIDEPKLVELILS